MSAATDDFTELIEPDNFKCSFLSYNEFQVLSSTPIRIVERAQLNIDNQEKELQKALGTIEAYKVNQGNSPFTHILSSYSHIHRGNIE
jgi:adenine-specific DNA methylase